VEVKIIPKTENGATEQIILVVFFDCRGVLRYGFVPIGQKSESGILPDPFMASATNTAKETTGTSAEI
jgi:hypothetical protein